MLRGVRRRPPAPLAHPSALPPSPPPAPAGGGRGESPAAAAAARLQRRRRRPWQQGGEGSALSAEIAPGGERRHVGIKSRHRSSIQSTSLQLGNNRNKSPFHQLKTAHRVVGGGEVQIAKDILPGARRRRPPGPATAAGSTPVPAHGTPSSPPRPRRRPPGAAAGGGGGLPFTVCPRSFGREPAFKPRPARGVPAAAAATDGAGAAAARGVKLRMPTGRGGPRPPPSRAAAAADCPGRRRRPPTPAHANSDGANDGAGRREGLRWVRSTFPSERRFKRGRPGGGTGSGGRTTRRSSVSVWNMLKHTVRISTKGSKDSGVYQDELDQLTRIIQGIEDKEHGEIQDQQHPLGFFSVPCNEKRVVIQRGDDKSSDIHFRPPAPIGAHHSAREIYLDEPGSIRSAGIEEQSVQFEDSSLQQQVVEKLHSNLLGAFGIETNKERSDISMKNNASKKDRASSCDHQWEQSASSTYRLRQDHLSKIFEDAVPVAIETDFSQKKNQPGEELALGSPDTSLAHEVPAGNDEDNTRPIMPTHSHQPLVPRHYYSPEKGFVPARIQEYISKENGAGKNNGFVHRPACQARHLPSCKVSDLSQPTEGENSGIPTVSAPTEHIELCASMESSVAGSDTEERSLGSRQSHPAERRHRGLASHRALASLVHDPESMRVTPAPEALAPLMKPLDQQGPDLMEEAESPPASAPGTRDSEVEGRSDVGASDEDTKDEWVQVDRVEEKDSEGGLEGGQSVDAAGQATPKLVEGWKAGEAQEAASEEDAEVPPTAAPMEPEELSASMGSYASGSDSTEEELQTLSSHPVERRHKRCRPAAVSSDPESMKMTPAPEAPAPLMKPLDQQRPDLVEEAESPHGSASGTRDSEVEGSSDVGSSDEDTEDEGGQEDQEEEKDSERELGAGLGANANDSQAAQSPNFSLPSSDFLGDEHDGKWGMGRSTTTRVPCRQIASSDHDDSDNENFQGTRGKSVDELISRARSLIAQSSGLVSQGDIDSNINSDHHEQTMEEKGSTLQQSGVVDPKVQARQLSLNRDKHMTKKPSAHELNFGFTPSRCKRSRSPVKHLDDITSLVNNPHGPSSGLKQSQSSLRTLDQQRFSRVDSNVGLVRSASFGFTRSPSHQRTPTAARSLIKNPTHSSPRFGYVRSASAKNLLRRSDDV